MGLHSWLTEVIRGTAYDPYNRNWELFPYFVYAGIVLILFTIWTIWDNYRQETPEEKVQRKIEEKEERVETVLIVLAMVFTFISMWALMRFPTSVDKYFPITLISTILLILTMVAYLIYKIYKKKKKNKQDLVKISTNGKEREGMSTMALKVGDYLNLGEEENDISV